MKEEGTPLRMVMESSFVMAKVTRMPSRMAPVSSRAESSEENIPPAVPTKNMVRMAIRAGNRPLQGTKLLVRIASRRSRGESMILHPTIPAALQPNPIHMVRSYRYVI